MGIRPESTSIPGGLEQAGLAGSKGAGNKSWSQSIARQYIGPVTPAFPVKFSESENPPVKNTGYRSRITQKIDSTILDRVEEVLWKDKVLRMDYKEIELSVESQIVHLSGYVVSASNEQRIMRAMEHIPDILGIKNALFLDDSLLGEVAMAIGQIDRTGKAKFFTGVRHGVVTLNGDVPDITLHAQAEKCAAGIPGVRGVLNHIRIRGRTQNPEDLRFLQPAINSQMYFSDGPSGTVQQVIINPNTRLVAAMVVQGPFSRWPETSGSWKAREKSLSRKIVIATGQIRYLTKQSGFLNTRLAESAQFADFESKDFILPEANWIPSFPYQREDVLFPAAYAAAVHPTEDELRYPMAEAPFVKERVFTISSSTIQS